MVNPEELKILQLIHHVFKTDKGEQLIKILSELYQETVLFDNDPNTMYYKLGKHDLIQAIKDYLSKNESDIDNPESPQDHPFD